MVAAGAGARCITDQPPYVKWYVAFLSDDIKPIYRFLETLQLSYLKKNIEVAIRTRCSNMHNM